MKGPLTVFLLLTVFCNGLSFKLAAQRYGRPQNTGDSLTINRVSFPAYLSKQIKPTDLLIDSVTFVTLKRKLGSPSELKSTFSDLKAENDSLYQVTVNQMEMIRQIYDQTDRLQYKILQNDKNLIHTEAEIINLEVKYNEALEVIEEGRMIKYRTRYIFRDKAEKRWFWTTWGIFIVVPTGVLLWTLNR